MTLDCDRTRPEALIEQEYYATSITPESTETVLSPRIEVLNLQSHIIFTLAGPKFECPGSYTAIW